MTEETQPMTHKRLAEKVGKGVTFHPFLDVVVQRIYELQYPRSGGYVSAEVAQAIRQELWDRTKELLKERAK